MEDILKGKALARSPTNFRGHLFEVEGVVEQARAAYLEQHGDASGAAAARERAKNALDTAIDIQESVIYGAIGSAAPSSTPPGR
jgi:hypothetical protein